MDKILVMCLAALVALSCAEETKHSSPKVQVYSFQPGQYGKDNTLICHVSKFHPPDITIQLMKNGQELPNAEQTDLAFENDWHFHLTKHVAFKPMEGDKYSCKVTHGKTVKDFAWESNMQHVSRGPDWWIDMTNASALFAAAFLLHHLQST